MLIKKIYFHKLYYGDYMKFMANKSFPKKLAERKNIDYARFLMHAYAGEISEETAIHQYLYQSMVLPNEMQEYKNILENISKVEMMHLHILGKTIKELGLYPVFADCSTKSTEYWRADYVNYEVYFEEMIKEDIKAEQEAIKDYKLLLNVIDDKYVQETLNHIIEDEYIHLEIFTKILDNLEA